MMNKQQKIRIFFFLLLGALLSGCGSQGSDFSVPCEERNVLFCEDFEGISPGQGESQLVSSTAFDQWWSTGDEDQEYLFLDFPLSGRSRTNMILLGDGFYKSRSSSFLYTIEIDLSTATRAALKYNLIYRTEKHWDGLVVFAVKGGFAGAGNENNWMLLTPGGGYPDTVLFNGTIIPGYSGIRSFWGHEEIDLDPLVGGKMVVGFYFVSDDYLEDWGVGLDDIVIEADAGTLLKETRGRINLEELDLNFFQEPLISGDIPRANVVIDTPCDGPEPVHLYEGQRVFSKAVSDSEQRILILHPESRTLCWVDQNDVWLDGDSGRLPRISDQKIEDSYLPICGYAERPTLPDLGCMDEENLSGDQPVLPYRLQAALVQGGRITTLLFELATPGVAATLTDDPRISDPVDVPVITSAESPGGRFLVDINGEKLTCEIEADQPGRVICQGLSLDAAGPLVGDLCWQGWHTYSGCPPDLFSVPDQCLPFGEVETCPLECPAGYVLDKTTSLCAINHSTASLGGKDDLCPAGFSVNQEAGCCVGRDYSFETNCPEGFYYSSEKSACLFLPVESGCPDGFNIDPDSGSCLPEILPVPPRCNPFEVHFPKTEVTVKESTRCLKEPKNSTELVSSLKPFSVVEVLGIGEDGQTLVINNPVYQIPCWAAMDDFYLEKLDLTILPIIPFE
ncbi:MAG: hypothetical protein HQ574_08080 [Chloroflexi bacterium]|nr:hypothetical protein [Chloroflexota bacterium]